MNNNSLLIRISAFILIIGGLSLFFAYKQISPISILGIGSSVTKSDYKDSPSSLPENFNGTFYLSLVPNNDTLPLGIYTYNLDNKTWARILVDNNVGVNDYSVNISPIISSDNSFMIFARKNNMLTNNEGGKFQIYTSTLDGKNLKQITSSPGKFKRDLAIDNSNKLIAYVVQHEGSTTTIDTILPESWDVYLTDLSGNVIRVANGTNPLFSPDSKKLIMLKNDGLHIFDISSFKNPRHIGLVVPTVDGRASQTMKISLSKDGKMMSWSSVNKEKVIVSKINSWDTFSYTPIKVIDAPAYWTAFSKNGKYLAVMKIRVSKAGNDYGVISVYDVNSKENVSRQVLSLGGYDEKYVWFGAWQ